MQSILKQARLILVVINTNTARGKSDGSAFMA